MLLKIYLMTITFTLICVLWGSLEVKGEYKRKFTKQERKILKKRKKVGKYASFIYLIVFITPILNILFTITYGLNLGEASTKIFEDCRQYLDELKDESGLPFVTVGEEK